ncbi:hypothetical protein M885DRAFT_610075 [Pelagophyceae sp. CCMP2097]|nr:hypothetical protein M885DRAFT_610075 [Pelagophyceae sp. CCMP2097]
MADLAALEAYIEANRPGDVAALLDSEVRRLADVASLKERGLAEAEAMEKMRLADLKASLEAKRLADEEKRLADLALEASLEAKRLAKVAEEKRFAAALEETHLADLEDQAHSTDAMDEASTDDLESVDVSAAAVASAADGGEFGVKPKKALKPFGAFKLAVKPQCTSACLALLGLALNDDPAPGWHREVVPRKCEAAVVDVSYFAPDGTRLRSGPDVLRHIEKAGADVRGLAAQEFVFSGKRPPNDVLERCWRLPSEMINAEMKKCWNALDEAARAGYAAPAGDDEAAAREKPAKSPRKRGASAPPLEATATRRRGRPPASPSSAVGGGFSADEAAPGGFSADEAAPPAPARARRHPNMRLFVAAVDETDDDDDVPTPPAPRRAGRTRPPAVRYTDGDGPDSAPASPSSAVGGGFSADEAALPAPARARRHPNMRLFVAAVDETDDDDDVPTPPAPRRAGRTRPPAVRYTDGDGPDSAWADSAWTDGQATVAATAVDAHAAPDTAYTLVATHDAIVAAGLAEPRGAASAVLQIVSPSAVEQVEHIASPSVRRAESLFSPCGATGDTGAGHSVQTFHVGEVDWGDAVSPSWIAGLLVLPPGEVTLTAAGRSAHVFFVHSGALELTFGSAADAGVFCAAPPSHFRLNARDQFHVPAGNAFQLKNHSATTPATLFCALIKPLIKPLA